MLWPEDCDLANNLVVPKKSWDFMLTTREGLQQLHSSKIWELVFFLFGTDIHISYLRAYDFWKTVHSQNIIIIVRKITHKAFWCSYLMNIKTEPVSSSSPLGSARRQNTHSGRSLLQRCMLCPMIILTNGLMSYVLIPIHRTCCNTCLMALG